MINKDSVTSPKAKELHQQQNAINKRKSTIDNYTSINSSLSRSRHRTNGNSIIEQKIRKLQNQRLARKLSEIHHRKIKQIEFFNKQTSVVVTNMKSREAYRFQRQKQIQRQNDQFVERLVERLNSHKSIFQHTEQQKTQFKKRKKSLKNKSKNHSVALPSIYFN